MNVKQNVVEQYLSEENKMAVEVTIKQNGPIRDYKLEAFIKDKFK